MDCLSTVTATEPDHEPSLRVVLVALATALVALGALAPAARAAEDYALGPDSQVQPGVPRGELTQHTWTSRVFPGTERDYWVYVPKQYDPKTPAASWSSRTAQAT